MSLVPLQPPGRVTRKARIYEAEIAQLRTQGHTLESIRQALASAGIDVSLSTVWREASRSRDKSAPPPTRQQSMSNASSSSVPQNVSVIEFSTRCDSAPGSVPQPAHTAEPQTTTLSGKDVAEAFRRCQNTNPLIRATRSHQPKEQS